MLPHFFSVLTSHFTVLTLFFVHYRANKRFFEVYTITGIIQELLRGCSTDQAFLALNLKSILYNLTSSS